jgi:hypothetical protein
MARAAAAPAARCRSFRPRSFMAMLGQLSTFPSTLYSKVSHCLLLALSGHPTCAVGCLLSGVKRTLASAQLRLNIVLPDITADEGKRMGSQSRRLAILSFAVTMLTLGLACASAEECDYKTCGALMTRDGSVSWGISGRREYAPDTKRACAELNACVRRAKNNSAGRAAPALAAGSSSSKSNQNGSATALKPQPADKQAKGAQSASTSAVHESGNAIPNADRSNGKPTPCFAVAEILVPVDCSPSGPQ